MKRFDIRVNGEYIEDVRHRIYDDNGQYSEGSIASELYEALEEVVRISDRDHESWFKAKNALAKARGES